MAQPAPDLSLVPDAVNEPRGAVRFLVAWPDDPRRSLAIGLGGALIGLIIAGAALFSTKGSISRDVPPEAVATVNGRPILASDFEAQMQTENGVSVDQATPGQRAALRDAMIREELFVQRGLELDEPSVDPDTRAALVAAVEQQIAVDATSQVPSEAVLRAFYEARRDQYSTLGSISVVDLVKSGPDAKVAMAAVSQTLKNGASIASVIPRFGLTATGKAADEELYFAARLHLGAKVFDAVRALESGQVSGPIDSPDGVHVVVIKTNVTPTPRPFDEARSQVYTDYKKDLQKRIEDGELAYLRGRADIQIAKAYR